jgi:hypothetical protein
VRFVDHESRNRELTKQGEERLGPEALRRDVEQAPRTAPRGANGRAAHLGRQQRVQGRGPDAPPIQLVDL